MTFIPGGGSGSSKISTSQDVALNNPRPGEPLVYSETLAKWVNGPVGVSSVSSLENVIARLEQAEARLNAIDNGSAPPNPVLNLYATPYETSVGLVWQSPNDSNVAQIVIRRAAGSTPPADKTVGTEVASLSSTTTSYTNGGLTSGTQYTYSVFTLDASGVASHPVSVVSTTLTGSSTSLKIDAGGSGAGGFSADAYFSGGATHTTTDSALMASLAAEHQSVRYGMSQYRMPASGRALIKIYMIELTFTAAGKRVFNILANGGTVYENIDIFSSVGRGVVLTRDIVSDPVDGYVTIGFSASADNAVVSAIEVLDGTGLTPTPLIVVENPNPNPDTGTGVALRRAEDFYDSIGVAGHLGYTNKTAAGNYGYWDLPKVKSAISELGIRHWRDSMEPKLVTRVNEVGADLGVKFTFHLSDPNLTADSNSGRTLQQCFDATLQVVSHVEALEGPNEWGGSDITQAEADAARKHTIDTVNLMKGNSLTANLRMLGPSLIPNDQASKIGDLTAYITHGNLHPYPGGSNPETSGLFTSNITPYANGISKHLPMQVTEAGYHNLVPWTNHRGTPEDVEAIYLPRMYAHYWDSSPKGADIRRTFSYEFIDQGDPNDREGNFGWIRRDTWERKPAFHTLRRLIGHVKGPAGLTYSPGRLDYTISGGNADTRIVPLRHRLGHSLLLVWQQTKIWDEAAQDGSKRLNPPNANLTLGLPVSTKIERFVLTSDTTAQTVTSSSLAWTQGAAMSVIKIS